MCVVNLATWNKNVIVGARDWTVQMSNPNLQRTHSHPPKLLGSVPDFLVYEDEKYL